MSLQGSHTSRWMVVAEGAPLITAGFKNLILTLPEKDYVGQSILSGNLSCRRLTFLSPVDSGVHKLSALRGYTYTQ